jgi:hypothetical protein
VSRESEHTCHAEGCERRVPPKMLMCARHWRMVPRVIQRDVWAQYQPGQERMDGTAGVTHDYLDAARAAVEAVATIEEVERHRALGGIGEATGG